MVSTVLMELADMMMDQYNLRMDELRTFSEIGSRTELSSAAVGRLFRRAYRDRNGISAPKPKLVKEDGIRSLITE